MNGHGPQAVEALRDSLLGGEAHLPLRTLQDAASQLRTHANDILLAPRATQATRPLLELLAELRERSNLARLAHAHLAPEMCALIRLELDADEWARNRLDLMLASEPPALLLEALVPILQNRLSAGAAVATAGPPPPLHGLDGRARPALPLQPLPSPRQRGPSPRSMGGMSPRIASHAADVR